MILFSVILNWNGMEWNGTGLQRVPVYYTHIHDTRKSKERFNLYIYTKNNYEKGENI